MNGIDPRIDEIIANPHLAKSICESISKALDCDFIHIVNGNSVWDIFNNSLLDASKNIESHPKDGLFKRLIKYGPVDPDMEDGIGQETYLTDSECESCLDFIYSHMINRFKGELAELLSLKPCIELIDLLKQKGEIPSDINIYFGGIVKERRRLKKQTASTETKWGSFTKGADCIFISGIDSIGKAIQYNITIHGVIEVKSMRVSNNKIINQIDQHINRLSGGIKIYDRIWEPNQIIIPTFKNDITKTKLYKILIMPSKWKLNRDYEYIRNQDGSSTMVHFESIKQTQTTIENIFNNVWKITLGWSEEALEQAGYEMTYWYMSQVGRKVFNKNNIPMAWDGMTPEEAGFNSIKMMLYYIILRPLNPRQKKIAIKLYNCYGFGYPLGKDHHEMIWCEDLS